MEARRRKAMSAMSMSTAGSCNEDQHWEEHDHAENEADEHDEADEHQMKMMFF